MQVATMKDVKDYFGIKEGQTLKDFTVEWSQLSTEAKEQIKVGLGNGSLTYE